MPRLFVNFQYNMCARKKINPFLEQFPPANRDGMGIDLD